MARMLETKIAIVTGSGRGIGRATAQRLAAEGARVLVTDLDPAPLEETIALIEVAGGTAQAIAGDVAAPEFPERLVEAVLEAYGGLDILVNNAGFTWDGTLHKMTDEQWQAMIDVHLTGPFRILRAAAPLLREAAKREIIEEGQAKPRKIVNVSSTSATRGNFGQANYAAAKAGLIGLTKTLAREWGPLNIQVNCVAFGLIDTRLTQAKESAAKTQWRQREVQLGIPSAIRDAAIQQIPMRRPGTAQEAAGVIFFFCSPLTDYVSGQVLEATGGL